MPEPDLSAAALAPTIGSALREHTAALRAAGIDAAAGDLRRLMMAVLELPAAVVLSRPETVLTPLQSDLLRSHVQRRMLREPVSRILGERDFYGRTFTITKATLDPRPDSETLIAVALDIVSREGWEKRPLRILDVGTGSGCLLLTLLAELPLARGLGTDISAGALSVARINAGRLGLAGRAEWLQADGLETSWGRFDIVISNPPYVRRSEIAQLQPEVRNHDPHLALDGGADGLAFYRRLAPAISGLTPEGWAVLEVGHDQSEAVAHMLGVAMPGAKVSLHSDLAGWQRCVAVKTRA